MNFVFYLPLSDPFASPLPVLSAIYYLWIPARFPIGTEKETKTISSYVQKEFSLFRDLFSLFPS